MAIQINPQEIHLLERYSSLEYFAELRDTWEKMVRHVESCLQLYSSNLEKKGCTWYLVERAQDSCETQQFEAINSAQLVRAAAGQS